MLVDHIHELNLLTSLSKIVLINADLVDPETAFLIGISKPFQSSIEASSKPKASITFVGCDGDLVISIAMRRTSDG